MENKEQVLKVSDWSQKYKLTVYAIAILGFGAFIYFFVMPWMNEVLVLLRQMVEYTKR